MKGVRKIFKAFKGSSSRSSPRHEDNKSSRLSSRRHSISEMESSDSGNLRRDQGLRGCSSRFSVDVEDVMEPVRRPRTCSQAQVPQPMNIDDDEEEEWEYASEGFSLRSSIEEQRYKSCKEELGPTLI